MKKQDGIALLEVLIAVSIMGVIMVYIAQLQSSQLAHQSQTLAAAKVAKIYQLSTQVMFEPLVRLKNSNVDDIASWQTNDTIHGLQNTVLAGGGFIYLDGSVSSAQVVANFFNGANYNTNTNSCDAMMGVEHERVNCIAGLNDEFNLTHSYRVRGIKVDGGAQSYFSINHIDNPDINQVKPTILTVFIDGLHDRSGLKEIYDLAEAVSEQVSQIDDMNSSAYAEIHIANFSGAEITFDTGRNAHEALLDSNFIIAGDMGLAIVFDLSGTQALRSDGMVAMQANRSLCWNVTVGGNANDVICQSAISSDPTQSDGADGNGDASAFMRTEGNLLYQTSDQNTADKVFRTPVEVVVGVFKNGSPIEIAKPVCPTIDGPRPLLPHLSVVGSSFSNSRFGHFPEADDLDYGDNQISNASNTAEMMSAMLFRWEDSPNSKAWMVTGNVGSPNDKTGTEGKNPDSLQIVALRWCEIKR